MSLNLHVIILALWVIDMNIHYDQNMYHYRFAHLPLGNPNIIYFEIINGRITKPGSGDTHL